MGRDALMNKHEYDFITNNWEGPKGAAYNQVWEFCREFGWLTSEGRITEKGTDAMREYVRIANGNPS